MKYSITIPAYKAKYLKEAIDSILAQTYKDFELIIVNDASPEDLDTIVKAYNDPRIRYFKNEKNCGALRVVDNWNICLSKVRGEFLICMGDDDRLLPECLEVYDKLIDKYPDLDVYHGWTEMIDENSQIFKMQEPRPEREGVYSAMLGRYMGRQQFIGDFLFRTAPLREAGGFFFVPMAWGSDDITALRAMVGKGVANTQQPVFQYRCNRLTLSSSSHGDLKMQGICLKAQWEKALIQRDNQQLDVPETIFHEVLKRDYENLFQGIQKYEIMKNFESGGRMRKLFHWLRVKKQYGLTNRMILISLLKSLK